MNTNNSLVCCGLDPDLKKIPKEIKGDLHTDRVEIFLRGVIDSTIDLVCCYKAQKAFFDVLDGGHELLAKIIRYIHNKDSEMCVIVDCKIGDIENTMEAYLENIFGKLDADGIVVNPYMGDDVFLPLDNYPDKSIVVLVKTSNPSASVVQDITTKTGLKLWEYILGLTLQRWNVHNNVIPVLSSNAGRIPSRAEIGIPDETPILFAGVGAQGGELEGIKPLLNSYRSGVFVNSSRVILYPNYIGHNWLAAVKSATQKLRDELNQIS